VFCGGLDGVGLGIERRLWWYFLYAGFSQQYEEYGFDLNFMTKEEVEYAEAKVCV
jgi:hypothetical protein